MSWPNAAILITWACLLVCSVPFLLRGTILQIDTADGRWWPFWLYIQFVLVLPAPVIIATQGVASFDALKVVTEDQAFHISILVLYAVTFFFLTLALWLRLLPTRWLTSAVHPPIKINRVNKFSFTVISVGLGLMILGILFLGAKHSYLTSLISNEGVLQVRLENRYNSSLPTQIEFVITVSWWIAAITSGYNFAWKNRWVATLFFMSAFIMASMSGAKSPVLQAILLSVIAYLVVKRKPLNLKNILKLGIIIGIPLCAFVYTWFSFALGDKTSGAVIDYLINRIFIVQMAGTYNGIALDTPLPGQSLFGWHAVPFASFLVDYVPYSKALMMKIGNYDFNEMGVMNSFFISEAYGIGGYALLFLSPFIIGSSWVIDTALVYIIMKWMFGRTIAGLYFLPISLMYFNVTSGFSGLAFFKQLILLTFVLGVFWIPWVLLYSVRKRNSN